MDSQRPDTSELQVNDLDNFADLGRGTDTPIQPTGAEFAAPSSISETPSGAQTNNPPAPPHDGEAADQIDEYMADLMHRYGMSSEAGHSEQGPIATQESDEPVIESPAPEETPRREPTVPAESTHGLTAMRDLANLNARRAIDKHFAEQLTKQAFAKFVLAALAMVVAVLMAEYSIAGGPMLFTTAVVATTCATMWVIQYLITTRRLLGLVNKKIVMPAGPIEGKKAVSMRANEDAALGSRVMRKRRFR